MQASNEWLPPGGKLGEILLQTRERVASLDRLAPPRGVPVETGSDGRGFIKRPSLRAKLVVSETVAVIAEVKRRSPSKGILNADLDAGTQAQAFERGGAAAVSVLTEPHHFGGSLADLTAAAAATGLPILRKDFHISPRQLVEAGNAQASVVLLIARALPPPDLALMIKMTGDAIGLESIVEVRTERELELALELGARMIGVNSRDLETLEVDERVPERLMPQIPSHVPGIWESGITVLDDVKRAADAGADAVLVGSALSRADDPESLVRSLCGLQRQRRNG